MDDQVKTQRQPQVRLENLDANTVRHLARELNVPIPYLLREAVQLLVAKHGKKVKPVPVGQ